MTLTSLPTSTVSPLSSNSLNSNLASCLTGTEILDVLSNCVPSPSSYFIDISILYGFCTRSDFAFISIEISFVPFAPMPSRYTVLEPDAGRNAGDAVFASCPSVGVLKSNSIFFTAVVLDVFFRCTISLKLLPAFTSSGSVENPVTITLGTDVDVVAVPLSPLSPPLYTIGSLLEMPVSAEGCCGCGSVCGFSSGFS